MKRVKSALAIVGAVSIVFVLIPLITGRIVSGNSFPWMNEQSQWIGFWGNYLGALIGGVLSGAVAVYVMKQTIEYEHAERDRKEKIEFCLKLNEYVMEYSSKVGNYSLHVATDSDNKVERAEEYNEIVRLSGIIVSLLNSRLKDKRYKGVENFVDITQKIINKFEETSNTSKKDIIVLVNELRYYSADFMEINY